MDKLHGVIRDYDWGDGRALAELLGHEPPGHPEAEYWLGAHPSAPATLLGPDQPLDAVVDRSPRAVLGPDVADRFGGIPYLLKVLAAARPLSIQAHPSRAQAKAGFAREELSGLGRGAPNRNYRDENHKPELICALTPFDAKCGFRPVGECHDVLDAFWPAGRGEPADVGELRARLAAGAGEADVLAATVGWLLRLPPERAASLAGALGERAAALTGDGRWAAGAADRGPADIVETVTWTVRIASDFPGDVGVVVALLLNHVTLEPGQAIFLEAGNLHSYLSGVGVELMANSDNVLRGGLTTKHRDVQELLDIVDYRPSVAPVQTPDGAVHRYRSPVPEFALTRMDSTAGVVPEQVAEVGGPEIVLVTAGGIELQTADRQLSLAAGEAAFVPFEDGRYRVIDRRPGETVAWRATTGGDRDR